MSATDGTHAATAGTSAEVVTAWSATGRSFDAAGVRSFVAERGAGDAVRCLHGVPASAFLYRKVLTELAARGDGAVRAPRPRRGLPAHALEAGLPPADAPAGALWGARDPALKPGVHGEIARRAAGLERLETVPGKHVLQEDQAPAIADRVARLAGRAGE